MQHTNTLSQIMALFNPIHRDGYKFVVPAAIATVVLFLIAKSLGVIAALVTVAFAFFFRDPERVTPIRDGVFVAPADGKVMGVSQVTPPVEFGLGLEPLPCVTIFLSIFDVHINRASSTGRIAASIAQPGLYHPAYTAEAGTENQRHALIVEGGDGIKTGIILMAGAVARRIVPLVNVGDHVTAGERIGLIRFGSRVDLYLPQNANVLVSQGQRMIGGETVVADLADLRPVTSFKRG